MDSLVQQRSNRELAATPGVCGLALNLRSVDAVSRARRWFRQRRSGTIELACLRSPWPGSPPRRPRLGAAAPGTVLIPALVRLLPRLPRLPRLKPKLQADPGPVGLPHRSLQMTKSAGFAVSLRSYSTSHLEAMRGKHFASGALRSSSCQDVDSSFQTVFDFKSPPYRGSTCSRSPGAESDVLPTGHLHRPKPGDP